MKTLLGVIVSGLLIAPAWAGPGLHGGPPVWCFGLNELDQCVLYLGNDHTCQNLTPCLGTTFGLPTGELTFCLGKDDRTGQCRLFLGTESQCASVEPCRAVNGRLPRAPLEE